MWCFKFIVASSIKVLVLNRMKQTQWRSYKEPVGQRSASWPYVALELVCIVKSIQWPEALTILEIILMTIG